MINCRGYRKHSTFFKVDISEREFTKSRKMSGPVYLVISMISIYYVILSL